MHSVRLRVGAAGRGRAGPCARIGSDSGGMCRCSELLVRGRFKAPRPCGHVAGRAQRAGGSGRPCPTVWNLDLYGPIQRLGETYLFTSSVHRGNEESSRWSTNRGFYGLKKKKRGNTNTMNKYSASVQSDCTQPTLTSNHDQQTTRNDHRHQLSHDITKDNKKSSPVATPPERE